MYQLAWIVFAATAAACGGAATAPAAPAMPALTVATLDGATWSPEEARGSVLVVDVWASWCKPCREGFPRLDELARKHGDARFVALSIDEERESIDAFLAQIPTGVTVVHDPTQQVLAEPLRVTHIPTLLVVDRHGIIRHRFVEPSAADYERLDAAITELVAAP